MAWLLLLIAGAFEVAFAIALKSTDGFKRPGPVIFTLLAMTGSLGMLSCSLRYLPLGLAYAIWTGLGTVGATLAGIWLFGEALSGLRILCLLLIVLGAVGLRLTVA